MITVDDVFRKSLKMHPGHTDMGPLAPYLSNYRSYTTLAYHESAIFSNKSGISRSSDLDRAHIIEFFYLTFKVRNNRFCVVVIIDHVSEKRLVKRGVRFNSS